jgi:hypothetical protein
LSSVTWPRFPTLRPGPRLFKSCGARCRPRCPVACLLERLRNNRRDLRRRASCRSSVRVSLGLGRSRTSGRGSFELLGTTLAIVSWRKWPRTAPSPSPSMSEAATLNVAGPVSRAGLAFYCHAQALPAAAMRPEITADRMPAPHDRAFADWRDRAHLVWHIQLWRGR